mgnify:CR=1 FL=1
MAADPKTPRGVLFKERAATGLNPLSRKSLCRFMACTRSRVSNVLRVNQLCRLIHGRLIGPSFVAHPVTVNLSNEQEFQHLIINKVFDQQLKLKGIQSD